MTTYIQEHVNALIDGLFTDCPDHGAMLDAIDEALETHREIAIDDGDRLPEPGSIATFGTPFEQHSERNGRPVRVTDYVTLPGEHHDAEVLPMAVVIDLTDGCVFEAWPEELALPVWGPR